MFTSGPADMCFDGERAPTVGWMLANQPRVRNYQRTERNLLPLRDIDNNVYSDSRLQIPFSLRNGIAC